VVLLRQVVYPSVRLYIEVSWSYKLEFFGNNSTDSWLGMFALCRPQHLGSTPRGTPWIFGRNSRGYRKSGSRSMKAQNIFETRQIGPSSKGYYWRPIGSHIHCTHFRLVPKSTTLDDLSLTFKVVDTVNAANWQNVSLALNYRDQIGHNTSKIIPHLISLGSSVFMDHNIMDLLQRKHPDGTTFRPIWLRLIWRVT